MTRPPEPLAEVVAPPGTEGPDQTATDGRVLKDEEIDLPPIPALVALVGAPTLFAALRESGEIREVLSGFQTRPASLNLPIVQRRLKRSLSRSPVVSRIGLDWSARRSPSLASIERLIAEGLEVEAALPPDQVRWGLLIHPNPLAKERLAEIEGSSSSPERVSTENGSTENGFDRGQPANASFHPPVAREMQSTKPDDRGPHPVVSGAAAETYRAETARLAEIVHERQREIQRLNRELAAAEAAAALERKRLEEASAEIQVLKLSAAKELDRSRSIARQLERTQAALEQERNRAAAAERFNRRQSREAPSQAETPSGASRQAVPSDWLADGPAARVIGSLLESGQFGAVAKFCRQAMQTAPTTTASQILLQALIGAGEMGEIAAFHYDQAVQALDGGSRPEAIRSLCESIKALPEGDEAHWRMEKLIQTARPESDAELESIASLHIALRRVSTSASVEFESMMKRMRRALWKKLPEVEARQKRGVQVEWSGPHGRESISATDLAAAVASSDEELVNRFRRWAAGRRDMERAAVQQVVDGANAHLPGSRRVLTAPTEPVIVDGSNVAFAGRSPEQKPTLDNIRQIRQALFEHGFFPVLVYADASLPWRIQERGRLDRWLSRGEMTLVEGRTDADEAILLEARRRNCPIVTNDRMREYDPEQRAEKITYSIGPGGVVLDVD